MKKLIYISGVVVANLLLFGAIFKLMHWPGANILLIVAILSFCFWFLPSALINSYKSQNQKKYQWLYIITFIVFFIDMMGALFKIMHWPGAGWLLIIGVPLPFVLFLPVYLYQTRKDKTDSLMNFMGIMIGLTFLAIFSSLLALNVSKSILEGMQTNFANNENNLEMLETKTSRLESNAVTQKADEICIYINNLKCELLEATGNKELCDNNILSNKIALEAISMLDNEDIPKNYLLNQGKIIELKNMISEYRQMLLDSNIENEDLIELINYFFDVSKKEILDKAQYGTYDWEYRQFASWHLVAVLNSLSQIESNVRFVESEI